MHHHPRLRFRWPVLLTVAAAATLVAACSSSGSTATPTSTSELTAKEAAALAKKAYAAQAALPKTPFPIEQRIGTGDWQLTVHAPTTQGPDTIVVADLVNGGTQAGTLDPAALFVLRDGLNGSPLPPTAATALGRVAPGKTASTTLTFRPPAPLTHPVLSFAGQSVGLSDVNVQLDLTPEAAAAAGSDG